jgi:SAM-dependent methyltransferase
MHQPADIEKAHHLRSFLESADRSPRSSATARIIGRASRKFVTPARVLGTRAMVPLSRRKLVKFSQRKPLLLHLGSGYERKEGWVNVDLVPVDVDLFWDLRNGIPFPDSSVDAIFHEHLLEHLQKLDGLRFSVECLRVLKPGGVLRVVVPDAGSAIRGYVGDGDRYVGPFPTGLMAIESLFYNDGHISMFDSTTLVLLLRAAGFRDVQQQEFGKSWLPVETPDTESRRVGSLYVDARKANQE